MRVLVLKLWDGVIFASYVDYVFWIVIDDEIATDGVSKENVSTEGERTSIYTEQYVLWWLIKQSKLGRAFHFGVITTHERLLPTASRSEGSVLPFAPARPPNRAG